jgi:hypothetical protein
MAFIRVCVAVVGTVPICAMRAVVVKAVVVKAVVMKAVVMEAVVMEAVVMEAVVMEAVVMPASIMKAGTARCCPTPIWPASPRPDERSRMEGAHPAAVKAPMRATAAPGRGVGQRKECPDEDSGSGADDNIADHEFLDRHQPSRAGLTSGTISPWTCKRAILPIKQAILVKPTVSTSQ